jgi:hypothetical protein
MDREKKERMGSPARSFSGEAVLVVANGEAPVGRDGGEVADEVRTRAAGSDT